MPLHRQKMKYLLDVLSYEQGNSFKQQIQESDVIEFGCGPGTFLWSLWEGVSEIKGSFIGIDQSGLMLEQAQMIADQIEADFLPLNDFKNLKKSSRPRVLVFGQVLNEISNDFAIEVLEFIDPEMVILIEPGTQECFRRVMDWRGICSDRGFESLFPCPSLNSTCPWIQEYKEHQSWCHQVIRPKMDEDHQRISQLVHLDQNHLAFIAHFYSKKGAASKSRMVSKRRETKFSFDFEFCEKNDSSLKRVDKKVLKKTIKKKQQKELKKINWGLSEDYLKAEMNLELKE